MSHDPQPGDESTSADQSTPRESTSADQSTPPDSEATDLDLREDQVEPVAEAETALAVTTAEDPALDGPVSLASLAFHLFATIESQFARDPHGPAFSGLTARLDVLERGVARAVNRAEAVAGLTERIEAIDAQLAAPDPHAGSVTALSDRLAAAEHRLAAPHPHTETVNSLVERVEVMETSGTPGNLAALEERLDLVEGQVPPPDLLSQMSRRMDGFERRLPLPEVIAGLAERIDEYEERLVMLEEPVTAKLGLGQRVLYGLIILAAAVTVVAIVLMTAA